MSQPPYRALRVVLGFLSLLLAIGGILRPPESPSKPAGNS
jgi:hypothetical protein